METQTQEQTTEAKAEEFVKEHTSSEIVSELVRYGNEVDRLQRGLDYFEEQNKLLSSKLDIVKNFITEHVKDDDSASVGELKDLAGELNITLTKRVNVEFTVTYKLTVECDIDEEVTDNDFKVSMDYDGVGELYDEQEDWSEITIEDED